MVRSLGPDGPLAKGSLSPRRGGSVVLKGTRRARRALHSTRNKALCNNLDPELLVGYLHLCEQAFYNSNKSVADYHIPCSLAIQYVSKGRIPVNQYVNKILGIRKNVSNLRDYVEETENCRGTTFFTRTFSRFTD